MKEKYFQIREIGGYSIVNNISFIKIKGSDSEKYINSQMSTQQESDAAKRQAQMRKYTFRGKSLEDLIALSAGEK